MMTPRREGLLFGLVGLLAWGSARAQTFPPDAEWVPLQCREGVMSDRPKDESGAQNERDLVGDAAFPAGFRAADAEHLFIRLRLDDDPAPGATLRPFSWGVLLDTNASATDYEVQLFVNGVAKTISVFANTSTTLPDDPADPPDEPPAATYQAGSSLRSIAAQGSTFSGGGDFFLDMAIPWADLRPLGLTPVTPVRAWAATGSGTISSLNGDLACHDGTTGAGTLSAAAAPPTALDPERDSDGDGYTDAVEIQAGTHPNDATSFPSDVSPNARLLEGGGGCGASGLPAAPLAWLVLAGGLRAGRRRLR